MERVMVLGRVVRCTAPEPVMPASGAPEGATMAKPLPKI